MGINNNQKAVGALGLTSVLVAGWSQAQQGINEARRIKAQNKARIKQMQDQFELSTQNLHNNNVAIKQNKMRNDVTIQESKLQSQDAFSQAFVGSGIKGRTVDTMAATLQGEVDKAHNQSQQQATQESDRQFLGLMRTSQQITQQISDMESFNFDAVESNMNMAMLSAGLDSAATVVGAAG